jgi:hypothetical protein
MQHAYITPSVVDAAVVHKQAHERMVDIRDPSDTLVHDHAYGADCQDQQHWLYSVGSRNSSKFTGTNEMTAQQAEV